MAFLALILLALQSPALAAGLDFIPQRQQISKLFEYHGGEIPVVVLDADQTVRVSRGRYRAPRGPGEVVLLPGVAEKLRELRAAGVMVVIASNQENPVAQVGLAAIDETMRETIRQMEEEGGLVSYYDFAVHEADAKPSPKMLERLEEKLRAKFGPAAKIDRLRSVMVGDAAYLAPTRFNPGEFRPDGNAGIDTSNFDRIFAENFGIPFREPGDFFSWRGVYRFRSYADYISYRRAHGLDPPDTCVNLYQQLLPNLSP